MRFLRSAEVLGRASGSGVDRQATDVANRGGMAIDQTSSAPRICGGSCVRHRPPHLSLDSLHSWTEMIQAHKHPLRFSVFQQA